MCVTVPSLLETVSEAAAAAGGVDIVLMGHGPCPDNAIPFAELLAAGPEGFDTKKEAIDASIDTNTHPVVYPYSSGTTGLPKAVMLSANNLVSQLCQLSHPDLFPLGDDDVIDAVLPFYHIYGMVLILPLCLLLLWMAASFYDICTACTAAVCTASAVCFHWIK